MAAAASVTCQKHSFKNYEPALPEVPFLRNDVLVTLL
jgi:hypothetical protein